MALGAIINKVAGDNLRRLGLSLRMRGEKIESIVVAKGYCLPSRSALTGILSPYGVWFDAPLADTLGPKDPDLKIPQYQTAVIFVKAKQAKWAEYLILSAKTPNGAGKFQVLSKPKDRRNAAWAARRSGLPMPWALKRGNLRSSWVEYECDDPALEGKIARDRNGRAAGVRGYGGILFTKERERRQPSRPTKKRGAR